MPFTVVVAVIILFFFQRQKSYKIIQVFRDM